MQLPSSCIGCTFYKYRDSPGNGYVPDHYVQGSKVLFIAQNGGADEVAGHKLIKRHFHGAGQYTDEWIQVPPQPLIGVTGQIFNNRFLPLSGLKREEVSVGNAIRCRPGLAMGMKADDLPHITTKMKLETSKADIVNALNHCKDSHLQIPSSVKLIVTMGRYAQFAMTGIQQEESEYGHKQGVVESWRGYAVTSNINRDTTPTKLSGNSYIPCSSNSVIDTAHYHDLQDDKKINIFFTMHIAALNYGANKKYYHATLNDFHKIKLLLQGKWPLPLPTWSNVAPVVWPKYAAFDTEYVVDTNELIRWSLCDTDNNLFCIESGDSSSLSIPISVGSTVLIQNALADINHLASIIDISSVNIEDMMLAHSVLWTGEPHSLNYINSMYGAFNRYKHLIHEEDQQQLYSALDAYEPMYSWRHHFIPEFKKDAVDCSKAGVQSSWQIYKKYRLPLIPIIDKSQRKGSKVNTPRLSDVQKIYQDRLQQIQEQARAITGDDKFNIGSSKRMREEIYG